MLSYISLIKVIQVFIQQMYLGNPFNNINNQPCFPQNYRLKKIKDYTYDTQTILGKGNFSTVHLASKDNTRQLLAIKVIKLNTITFAKLEELLQQEINIICGLDHPNIIRCYEVLKSNNHCYFITELCEQGNLQKTLKERGPFKEHEMWPYVKDIFQGLKYLSSKNIVHRDIKTANIFLKNGTSKIADFGFAIQARQSFQDMSIGSPLYMAPEGYIKNRYGPKTDVWAFGIVLYELLHGFTPFHHCQNDDDLKNCQRMPLNPSQIRWDVSFQLKDLILRCLTIDENERISINQIEKTPYMQKHMLGGNLPPPQRLIVSSYKKADTKKLVRKNTGDTNTTMDHETMENPQKQNMSCKKEHVIKKNQSQKCLKLDFYRPAANNCEIPPNNKNVKAEKKQELIKGQISFNEAIGLIHFCRIGFKCLLQPVSDQIICGIKALILSILEEILVRINKGMIIYDFADNRQDKEAKLRKVVKEYIQKYNKSLLKYKEIKIDFKDLQKKMANFLQEAEISKTATVNCCYLSLMFLVCAQYLRWSSLSKSYNIFSKNQMIDTCLDEKSIPSTYSEYIDLRKKYQSIIVF